MHIEVIPRRKHSISLTPLIDVVFILLVFFMLATSFTDWRPITLATGTSQATPGQTPPAVVRINADGTLSYERQVVPADALAARLKSARNRGDISAVIVQPNADADLDATVTALDTLYGAGVAPISLATGTASSSAQGSSATGDGSTP
ncbi:ExbD/TolR family protein [Salinisphaera aquimarina]|uniref:ExbD/TolR family protein n=1 Tax=Salinisphaera aquimarina TaxID=2094031 RepID=A0ABV7EQC6_9GAMM